MPDCCAFPIDLDETLSWYVAVMGYEAERYAREQQKDKRRKLIGNIALAVGISAAAAVVLWVFVLG
ncbi:hypothetical protein D3C85_1826340 [compost metagenome]